MTKESGFNCKQRQRLPPVSHSPDFWRHLATQSVRTEGSGGVMWVVFKAARLKADHSLLTDAKVKKSWSCTSAALYVIISWCLIKNRYSFKFTGIIFLLPTVYQLLGRCSGNKNLPVYFYGECSGIWKETFMECLSIDLPFLHFPANTKGSR